MTAPEEPVAEIEALRRLGARTGTCLRCEKKFIVPAVGTFIVDQHRSEGGPRSRYACSLQCAIEALEFMTDGYVWRDGLLGGYPYYEKWPTLESKLGLCTETVKANLIAAGYQLESCHACKERYVLTSTNFVVMGCDPSVDYDFDSGMMIALPVCSYKCGAHVLATGPFGESSVLLRGDNPVLDRRTIDGRRQDRF